MIKLLKLEFCQVHKMRKNPLYNEKRREINFPVAEDEHITHHVTAQCSPLQSRAAQYRAEPRKPRHPVSRVTPVTLATLVNVVTPKSLFRNRIVYSSFTLLCFFNKELRMLSRSLSVY